MKKPDGEWRKRNDKWYRAEIKKIWHVYMTKICPVCKEEFLTRHDSHTCSPTCRANLYWKKIPIEKRWKTKTIHKSTGYVYLRDGSGKNIAEHRYIMSKIIGRELNQAEQVHHINGIRNDNRPENLVLLSRAGHNIIHKPEQAKTAKRDCVGKFIKKS